MAPCKKLKINDVTSSPPASQDLAEEQPMAECSQRRRRSARLQLLAKCRSMYDIKLPFPDDYLAELSLEIICRILDYLPLRDVLKMECLSKKMKQAVDLHLRLRRVVDFTEGSIYGWMSDKIHDSTLAHLIGHCTELEYIYGFHPHFIGQRRQRGVNMLSIPGVIHALSSAPKLKGVEISDIFLLEAILKYLPKLEILGTFKNRDCFFPIFCNNKLSLLSNPLITSLHLTGVVIPELPRMQTLKHLYLRFVRLTQHQPFRDFAAPSLQTFVMAHCAGPINPLRHVPLITSLAMAKSLQRLELLRVPFLGGLIQHIVDDSWRVQGFRNLQAITFGACKHAMEVDLGFLIITCEARLTDLCVQPSLTKDNLFAALTMAEVTFPNFKSLTLGFVDSFPEPGKWTADELLTEGLVEVQENPAMITDIGMKAVGRCFPSVSHLEIYNCPHLHYPSSWFHPDTNCWSNLKDLHLRRCHAIRLDDLNAFIPMLPSLLSLHLEFMLREPPKGCARVGLSAGTGLGVSSALVQNNGADAHNQANGAGAAANNQPQAAPGPQPAAERAEAEAAAAPPPPSPPPSPPPLPPSPPPLPPSPEQPPPHLPPTDQPPPPLLPEPSTQHRSHALSQDRPPHRSPTHRLCAAEYPGPSTSQNSSTLQESGGASSSSLQRRTGKKNSKEQSCCLRKSGEVDSKNSQNSDLSSGCCRRIEPETSSSSRHPRVSDQLTIDNNSGYLSEQDDLYSTVKAGPSGLNPHSCCCTTTSVIASQRVNQQIGNKTSKVTKGCAEKAGKHTAKCNAHPKSAYGSFASPASVISPDTSSAQPSTSGLNVCNSVSTTSRHCTHNGSSSSSGSCSSSNGSDRGTGQYGRESGFNHHCSNSSSSTTTINNNNNGRKSIIGHCNSSSSCGCSSNNSNEINDIYEDCNKTSSSKISGIHDDCHHSSCSRDIKNYNDVNDDDDGHSHNNNSANDWLHEKHKKNLINVTQRKRMRGSGDCCSHSSDGECAKLHSTSKTFPETLSPGRESNSSDNHSTHNFGESSSTKKCLHKSINKKEKLASKSTERSARVCEPQPSTSSCDSMFDLVPPATCDKAADVPPLPATNNMQSPADPTALVNRKQSNTCCTSNNLPSTCCSATEAHRKLKCEEKKTPTVSPKGKCLRSGFKMKSSAKATTKSEKGCDSSSLSLQPSSSHCNPSSSLSSSPTSSTSSFYSNGPAKINQSCQAVSEEIRETTKKAKENEDANKSSENSDERSASSSSSSVNNRSHGSVRNSANCVSQSGWTARSGPKYSYTRKSVKRKMNTCDQATSTSDPVQEEDHIQVLGVQSKTLTTLTLHMVGITNLCLLDCPNLATVSCSACRVLKKISIGRCSKLTRISFAQCKKLQEDQVIKELFQLHSDTSRVLFLRPMHQLQIPMVSLFGGENHSRSYHCLVKDHCKQPSMMVLNRKRAEILVDLLPNINRCLREIHENTVTEIEEEDEEECARFIHNFEEINEDGSILEVKTDIPWLKYFLQDYSDQKEKDTLPNTPIARELASERLRQLGETIIKEGIQGHFWCNSVFLVYINMCDISGLPTPDIYV
ncbi:F-box only protein 38-like [Argonauta hians]